MRTSKHTRSIFIAAALLMAGCGGKVGEAYNQGNDDGYRDGYEQCKKTFSDLHLEQALAQGTMVLLYLYAMILIFQEICKP